MKIKKINKMKIFGGEFHFEKRVYEDGLIIKKLWNFNFVKLKTENEVSNYTFGLQHTKKDSEKKIHYIIRKQIFEKI